MSDKILLARLFPDIDDVVGVCEDVRDSVTASCLCSSTTSLFASRSSLPLSSSPEE